MDASQKNLLTFGYVREYCIMEDIEFLPEDIVGLFVIWLMLRDYFDEGLSHPSIDIISVDGTLQQVKTKSTGSTTDWFSAIGSAIIRKGERFEWKFIVDCPILYKMEMELGIIDNAIMKSDEFIGDFAAPPWNGWGLYLYDMTPYHGNDGALFNYGRQFQYEEGDTITMILDLSQTENKNGTLSFEIAAKLKDNEKELSFFKQKY